MDLTQLRTFVAVAQEGHLTRAAERLHISQPAASAHIRALESHFELQLFSRTPRGLELTPAGHRLAERAGRVLGATLELVSLARELRGGPTGRLSIGSNADPMFSRLGPLVNWLRSEHPLLELNIEVRSSLATKEGVLAGELNAGFLLGSGFEKGLTGMVLAPLEYRIAASPRWADAMREADLKALAALPWIVTAIGTSNYEMREHLFRTHGLQVNAAIEVNNDLLVRTFIADGVGVGLVRRDHAEEGERQGIFALSAAGVGRTNLLFIHPEGHHTDPLLQASLEGVRTVWRDVLEPVVPR